MGTFATICRTDCVSVTSAPAEFFGYCKMAGPIAKQEKRLSWKKNGGDDAEGSKESSGSSSQNKPATGSKLRELVIPDDTPLPDKSSLAVPVSPFPQSGETYLSSPSGSHMVAGSPQPLTPSGPPSVAPSALSSQPMSAEGSVDYMSVQKPERYHSHTNHALTDPTWQQRVLQEHHDERRGGSLDPSVLADMHKLDMKAATETAASRLEKEQLAAGSSNRAGYMDGDGVLRKDTALTPEERNARLNEHGHADGSEPDVAADPAENSPHAETGEEGWGRPFKVEWIRV